MEENDKRVSWSERLYLILLAVPMLGMALLILVMVSSTSLSDEGRVPQILFSLPALPTSLIFVVCGGGLLYRGLKPGSFKSSR